MRTVVRNSFARQTIRAERVRIPNLQATELTRASYYSCAECGGYRQTAKRYLDPRDPRQPAPWLYRFHVDDDQGSRQSGPIAGGKLFCSRGCCESYTGQAFDEREG